MDLSSLITAIASIPDVIWAAVIASLLTLGGVLLTNRGSSKRLRMQLNHDSAQRDRERQMALRRDVYLPAAESVTRLQALLGSLIDLRTPDENLSRESTTHIAVISKISVIGSIKTVAAVSALLNEFNSAFLDLSFHRIILIERQKTIDQLARSLETFRAARLQWPDALKDLESTPDPGNSDLRKILYDGILESAQLYKDESKQLDVLQADQNKESLELLSLCRDLAFKVAELGPPALFAAREEIELPLPQEEYMKIQTASLQKNKALFDAFRKRVEDFARSYDQ